MEGGSKSLLSLIEIVISLAIFAFAVLLTLQIFLMGKYLGDRTSDSTDAIFILQNKAEYYKSESAREELEKKTLDSTQSPIYYDGEWNITDKKEEAVFEFNCNVSIKEYNYGNIYEIEMNVYKTEPYPFINDKNVKADPEYRPLLAAITADKFIPAK